MNYTPNLTRAEWKRGLIAMILCLAVLPCLVALLPDSIRPGQKNFICYFLNFAITTWLLRGFLLRNLRAAVERLFPVVYYAILGYLGYMAMGELTGWLIRLLSPGFLNLNDGAILSQLHQDFPLMALGTVVLAPVAEECFFRGVLLRGCYDRSPVLAWLLSTGLFAVFHVAGFLGTYSPLDLTLALVQYLPAGIVLGFAYHRGGSILSPILTHILINAVALCSAMGWEVL